RGPTIISSEQVLERAPREALTTSTSVVKDALLDSSYGMPGAPFPLEDLGMFDAMRAGLEGSADPSYSNDGVGYENGNLITLGLPISNGCGFPGATLPMSLMNPLHDAIPRYLAVYWERVHPVLPIVHRSSFENAPEEVLRYAMAAVATQLLDDEEDRVKGSQLHDFAWREVKKVSRPPWIPSGFKHTLRRLEFVH
ncbi:hypothetical protein N0V85_009265, partial [Neurospora sp. IMI 360204]